MLNPYIRLMRLEKPIGILLLLWPTLWALTIAANGHVPLKVLVVFVLGTILMRSAGCVINDVADRKFDGAVKRTSSRPLATGEVGLKQALVLFFVLRIFAAGLVVYLDRSLLWVAFAGDLIAIIYPFCKRILVTPQIVLGVAFSWGIPMAFLCLHQSLGLSVALLVMINLLWVVAYDTYYALVDKDDDLKIGVKSTAIFFGDYSRQVILSMQFIMALAWLVLAQQLKLAYVFYIFWAVAHGLFIYQYVQTKSLARERCFNAFLQNNWYGAIIYLGLLFAYTP